MYKEFFLEHQLLTSLCFSDSSEGGCEGKSNDNKGPPEGEEAGNAGSAARVMQNTQSVSFVFQWP